ncbi:MAG TPA: hypothetical protein VGF67_28855 [Ktedonobacteraceae bacterium]|jgi:hypothetical protein
MVSPRSLKGFLLAFLLGFAGGCLFVGNSAMGGNNGQIGLFFAGLLTIAGLLAGLASLRF